MISAEDGYNSSRQTSSVGLPPLSEQQQQQHLADGDSRGKSTSGSEQESEEDSDKDDRERHSRHTTLTSERNNTGDRSTMGLGGKKGSMAGPGGIDKEKKIGHRRVGVGGQITYKKIETSQIMGSIQLGISHAVGGLASKPERDLLMQDFMTVETHLFLSEGSTSTPAHHFSDFRFKTYAPMAFRYFRDLFGIAPDDFLISMCDSPLRELSNPGASGSIFYLTPDDEFIIKTVMHKEGEFLQKLLPGYYMNLNQNPRTLLPKFFGLYCYQCNAKNVRLCVMNNLLPSNVKLHQKYDLKGSTYKRRASKSERAKSSPTFKDLDFMEHHPEGIYLEAETYAALMKTILRDCRVLESFKIMDYSMLVALHNIDQAAREKSLRMNQAIVDNIGAQDGYGNGNGFAFEGGGGTPVEPGWGGTVADEYAPPPAFNRNLSVQEQAGEGLRGGGNASVLSTAPGGGQKQKLVAHSTAMESIQAVDNSELPVDEVDVQVPYSGGGIPARNSKGERVLMFIGIIDILQSYRLEKKLEHTWKSMIHDGDTVSVHRPSFYSQRFQDFMAKKVFKKVPAGLLAKIAAQPSKRRGPLPSITSMPPASATANARARFFSHSDAGDTSAYRASTLDSSAIAPSISPRNPSLIRTSFLPVASTVPTASVAASAIPMGVAGKSVLLRASVPNLADSSSSAGPRSALRYSGGTNTLPSASRQRASLAPGMIPTFVTAPHAYTAVTTKTTTSLPDDGDHTQTVMSSSNNNSSGDSASTVKLTPPPSRHQQHSPPGDAGISDSPSSVRSYPAVLKGRKGSKVRLPSLLTSSRASASTSAAKTQPPVPSAIGYRSSSLQSTVETGASSSYDGSNSRLKSRDTHSSNLEIYRETSV